MVTQTNSEIIGKVIGNLRIISEIGKGGMGVVYLAEHVRLQKRFAVKSLAPELTQEPHFRDRFYEEANNQALLDHPNIVQAIDLFDTEDHFFLVMDYVDGDDLSELIAKKGRLSENEALHIIKDVLSGLDFAHRKGIIHRDIKPSNILVDRAGRARIMDFGIAILTGSKRLTRDGTAIGSPWYMSPEQIVHPQDIDHRSDVYSAGIVLYEMLTGEVPFDGESDFTVKDLQVNSPITNPRKKNPDIAPGLAKIIIKAVEKTPANRFSGCAHFLKAIEEIERPPPPPAKRWILGASVAIAVLSIGVTGYFLLFRTTPIVEESGDFYSLENSKKERVNEKAAFTLIQNLSEKGFLACLEMLRLKNKKQALLVAKNVGEIELFNEISVQVQDHKANIERAVPDYSDLISQLSEFDEEVVTVAFDKYTEFLAQRESFEQINFTRAAKGHYKKLLDYDKSVTAMTLEEACRSNLPELR